MLPEFLTTLFSRLDRWLLAPETAVSRPADRRTARLVAFLTLTMILATLIEQTFSGNVPLGVTLLLLLAYALSRTRHQFSAYLILNIALCVPSYIIAWQLPNPTPASLATALAWLTFPLILTTILFPLGWATLIAGSNILLIILLPLVHPTITFTDVVGPLGFLGTLSVLLLSLMRYRNILEQERQAELRTSTDRLHLALDAVQIGIWDWDIPSGKVAWTEQVYTLFQQTPDTFDGSLQAYLTLVHPADRDSVNLAVQNALSGRDKVYLVTHRIFLPNGQTRWIEGKGQVYLDPQGRARRIIGTVHDITVAKELETLMQQQARQNKMLAELAQNLAAASQDYNRVLQLIVEQAATFLGDGASIRMPSADKQFVELAAVYNADPNHTRAFRDMMATLPQPIDGGLFGQIYHTNQAIFIPEVDQEKLLAAAIPEHRPYLKKLLFHSIILCPMRAQDQILGVLGLARHTPDRPYTTSDFHFAQTLADRAALAIVNARLYADLQAELAERRRIEGERVALIGELETKNAELERFTYTVSHDLKSPLVTVRGFLGYLEKDLQSRSSDRVQKDLNHIHQAIDKMHHLLNDLLELSRIGRLINTPEHVPFGELAADAVQLVSGQLEMRNGATITIQPDLPMVYGDRTRLMEVLQNLLDNALKFMGDQPQPRIVIGAQQQNGAPVFFVQDNGLGIPAPYQEQIFGLFDRLDPTVEGTGIGLALVKRIIEVHNGRIWVESAGPGQGSTFYFTLNSEPAANAA